MSLRIYPNEEEFLSDLMSRTRGYEIGLIPCTENLHPGYHQLFEKARQENDWVVAVGLSQEEFAQVTIAERSSGLSEQDREDLYQYGVDAYVRLDEQLGEEFEIKDMKWSQSLELDPDLVDRMCSRFLHLYSLYQPKRVYLYDLYSRENLILRALAKRFFPRIEVVCQPLVRSQEGLAHSSSNFFLTASELEQAQSIHKVLTEKYRDCVGLSVYRVGEKITASLEEKEFESVKVNFFNDDGQHFETIGRKTKVFVSVRIANKTLVDHLSLNLGERSY